MASYVDIVLTKEEYELCTNVTESFGTWIRAGGLLSYTVLLYDHLLTLGDEVKYIWRKKKRGPLIWLFFLNRYMTPLAFVGNLYAYFSGTFTHERCMHFVRYEGATTMIGINIASLMMLLRVYAMYSKRRLVVALVTIVFCLEFGTNAWLLSHGIAVNHSPRVRACSMIFDSSKVPRIATSSTAWSVLIYDTLVLGLTLFCTYNSIRNQTVANTMKVLLKEGLLYYSVIFCVTLVLTLMVAFAPPGIQNVCAQMEYLLTVTMMSRITLHLKRSAHKQELLGYRYELSTNMTSAWRAGSQIQFLEARRENLTGTHSPFSISVQEQTVMHDDQGEVIQTFRKTLPRILSHPRSPPRSPHLKPDAGGREEWLEFAALRGHEDRGRSKDSEEVQVRKFPWEGH
ncbi:hypothetical protein GSI_15307 [Ganoderma sinense ZZ0214-1]|uniref:DUF6533 domain-containing protein n=1 Tax=Ganoderma sinense ZZ0214-1 TaxID=1077348 RepID=A0A2G8RM72_9APHY|nr:hypothetical protein GSI_15307 [Ganoderma sinense ZZ0214-1]